MHSHATGARGCTPYTAAARNVSETSKHCTCLYSLAHHQIARSFSIYTIAPCIGVILCAYFRLLISCSILLACLEAVQGSSWFELSYHLVSADSIDLSCLHYKCERYPSKRQAQLVHAEGMSNLLACRHFACSLQKSGGKQTKQLFRTLLWIYKHSP